MGHNNDMRRPRLLDTSTWKATLKGEGKLCAVRKEIFSEVTQTDGRFDFCLSTPAVDRHGDRVSQKGWRLENYQKNPVVLWAHDQNMPPVGKAPVVLVENGRLVARGVEFTPRDLSPFGHMVGEMYRNGFLRGVSVGFLPASFKYAEDRSEMAIDFEEQELLEFSAVPVPANPEALQEAKALGIELSPMLRWAEAILDTTDGTQTVQRGMAERVFSTLNTKRSFPMSQKQEMVSPDEMAQPENGDSVEIEIPGGLQQLHDLLMLLMGEMKAMRQEMVELVEKMGGYMKEMKLHPENPTQEMPPLEPMKAKTELVAKKVNEEVKRRIAAMLGRLD
ncbi:MAG: hypothetical protein EBS90_12190 [Betaproteobacteria bacterium]|nr:hypothetical protein [Betaproteobacteria bacterium]